MNGLSCYYVRAIQMKQYDGHTSITSCLALIQLLYSTYNYCMESDSPPPVDLALIPHLTLYELTEVLVLDSM